MAPVQNKDDMLPAIAIDAPWTIINFYIVLCHSQDMFCVLTALTIICTFSFKLTRNYATDHIEKPE